MAGTQTYPFGGSTYTWQQAHNTTHISGATGELQLKELFTRVGERSFWAPHMSTGNDDVIVVKNDLTKESGDVLHFYLITPDTDAPIDNAYEAWGAEATSTVYADKVELGIVKHAKRIDCPASDQRAIFNIIEQLTELQVQWWIEYGEDKWITNQLSGQSYLDAGSTAVGDAGVAHSHLMCPGSATGTGDLIDTDTVDLELLYMAKEAARTGKIGSTTVTKLHPCKLITGGYGYKVVFGPHSVYNLTHDPDWKDTWKMDVRGQNTMLIKGEGNLAGMQATPFARIDDLELYSYANVYSSAAWGVGGNVAGEMNLFLGAQALLYATCQGPEWFEGVGHYQKDAGGRKSGEYYGVMIRIMMGLKKARFNSLDQGVIALPCAAKSHYEKV